MTYATQDFLEANAPDGNLTPQQAATLLEMAQGDTGQPEIGDVPSIAADAVDSNQAQPTPNPGPEPTPVIMAKDGLHTIPFEKLAEARASENHWKSQAHEMAAQLAAMQGMAQQRADAGVAPTQDEQSLAASIEANPEIFGDFSEGALAKGIQRLVMAGVAREVGVIRGELAQVVEPLRQKQMVDATQGHYSSIYERHPDADSIAESKELAQWINSQPSFARDGYGSVLSNGTTEQVIELFDQFKRATGATGATTTGAPSARSAAMAAIASAPQTAPFSLSDIPGGRPGAGNWMDVLANKPVHDMAEAMQGMTPDQIEAFLSRQ